MVLRESAKCPENYLVCSMVKVSLPCNGMASLVLSLPIISETYFVCVLVSGEFGRRLPNGGSPRVTPEQSAFHNYSQLNM